MFTAFSGYDSQCLALNRLGIDYDLVGWSEIDPAAIKAHDALFPQYADRNYGDISKIDWSVVPDFDLFTYSSPCTDFSNDMADRDFFKCVMANQWEPGLKDQFAANIYKERFPDDLLINDDVKNINGENYNADLLMGGFPCQDYSVARNKTKSLGIEGKKGVLWWQVIRIITEMKSKPKYLLFENVDRMIISPSKQRGRDFALIIQSLVNLGYNMEWRIINAAEYGMPQKRRRIFIFAFLKGEFEVTTPDKWLYSDGILAKAFPVKQNVDSGLWGLDGRKLSSDLVNLSDNFNKKNAVLNPFENSGVVIDGLVYTDKLTPDYSGPYTTLGDILVKGDDRKYVTDEYYISNDELSKWQYAKGPKQIPRTNKDGHEYMYL